MEISQYERAGFLKFTDAGEVFYLRISEIIMVCKGEVSAGEYETVITLRNGKAFQVSSTAEEVIMEYLEPD